MMYRVVTCAKKLVSPSALENACLWYGVEGWRNITFLSRRSLASTSFRTINNIILMGSPGAGKTVVGKTLASQLDMFWVDVDDDVLEPTWQMSVGEKLAEVGSKRFLDLEADAFIAKTFEQSVISLTGSQPMNDSAMAHARSLGLLVYLDVSSEDILQRLAKMKVDRVVGQEGGVSMAAILEYRQQFYERNYDLRVICERNEPPLSVTGKVIDAIRNHISEKGVASTRSSSCSDTFINATINGIAPDRGLYVSDSPVPRMTTGQWDRLVGMPYNEFALRILEQWIPPADMSHKDIQKLVNMAYTRENFSHEDVAPIVPLEGKQYMLELFHGPTGSFKDIPLQLTARLFDYAIKRNGQHVRPLILVATSGDTGGAVLNAFSRHTGSCDVVILFPENGVSAIQKAQMTSVTSPRTCVIGVKGDFDFCQTAIKDTFTDEAYNDWLSKKFGYVLSAANSINIARLLPQVVYHAWSYILMVRNGHVGLGDEVDICIPTGNFGNILGAYYAKQMGLPFRRMIVASNENKILSEFLTSGDYDINNRKSSSMGNGPMIVEGRLKMTSSPAIDILKSSNLERYLYSASGNDHQLVSSLFSSLEQTGRFSVRQSPQLFSRIQCDFTSDWCTDSDSKMTIKETFKRTGYMLDPHTAVAKYVADRHNSDVPTIISATAHFSKFSESILDAFGMHAPADNPKELMKGVIQMTDKPAVHECLWNDVKMARHHQQVCEADLHDIRTRIEEYLSRRRDERR